MNPETTPTPSAPTPAPVWENVDVPSAFDLPTVGSGWSADDDIPSALDILESTER